MIHVRDDLYHLAARLAALEAIVTHVTVPLLVATAPELARELLAKVRSDLVVSVPSQREHLALLAEEYLAKLADGVEARVRAKIGSRR